MRKALIMGAAGRDFHNFNLYFRNNPEFRVVAFTATQIPYISDRTYPASLAGNGYPGGIPIHPEEELEQIIEKEGVNDVYFSYSDVSHEYVMHIASRVQAMGASFHLLGPEDTMLKSKKPVVAVVASRTGAGKSTISRKVVGILAKAGLKSVVVRHPMPYGDLTVAVQRFETLEDLDRFHVTVEEREEYEGHIRYGTIVYAGVDYGAILEQAEKEGDVVIWDGGNNDFGFYRSDLTIAVVDPMRPGHESKYYPGETNVRMADIVVVNKVNVASDRDVKTVLQNCAALNSRAKVVRMASEALLDDPELVRGKNALAVEDGPTVTHGGLAYAAGASAAQSVGAKLIDPRNYAVGSIRAAFEKYPNLGSVIPALGYSAEQLKDLEESINGVKCDVVVLGTPSDITKLIKINKPVARVRFEAVDVQEPSLAELMAPWITRLKSR